MEHSVKFIIHEKDTKHISTQERPFATFKCYSIEKEKNKK